MADKAGNRAKRAAARSGANLTSQPPKPPKRGEDSGVFEIPKPKPAPTPVSTRPPGTPAQPQNRPTAKTILGRMGPQAITPAMTPLMMASRLQADQARDRAAAEVTTLSPLSGADEGTLLELPTRSYTRPEETEQEHEQKRQQKMMRTMQSFLTPSGVPLETAVQTPQEPARRGVPQQEERPFGPPPEAMVRDEMEQAIRLEDDRQRSAEDEAEAQLQATKQADAAARAKIKHVQRLWRMIAGVEAITAMSVFTLVPLILQMNLQVFNKFFFKKKFIPTPSFPEIYITCCVNCSCLSCGMFILLILIGGLGLIASVQTNPWYTFQQIFAPLVEGLFK